MPFEFVELWNGLILIKPKRFPDSRGYFEEVFKAKDFEKYGIPTPIQANMSFSKRGVVRGLHYQLPPKEQGKIVFVPKGKILDVAVDIRKSSANFGKFASVELSDENGLMLYIPPGFAHGFQALEDSLVMYFVTHNDYSPENEGCIHYSLIDWPIKEIVVSHKDGNCPKLEDAKVF
jgi:dTDP-4-dehydrorhamnose 3,5-epimerase